MWQHFFRMLHFHITEVTTGIAILHMQCCYVWISCSLLFRKYLYTMKFFVFSFFFLLVCTTDLLQYGCFLLFHSIQNQMLYSTTTSDIYMCMRVTLFYLWQNICELGLANYYIINFTLIIFSLFAHFYFLIMYTLKNLLIYSISRSFVLT